MLKLSLRKKIKLMDSHQLSIKNLTMMWIWEAMASTHHQLWELHNKTMVVEHLHIQHSVLQIIKVDSHLHMALNLLQCTEECLLLMTDIPLLLIKVDTEISLLQSITLQHLLFINQLLVVLIHQLLIKLVQSTLLPLKTSEVLLTIVVLVQVITELQVVLVQVQFTHPLLVEDINLQATVPHRIKVLEAIRQLIKVSYHKLN